VKNGNLSQERNRQHQTNQELNLVSAGENDDAWQKDVLVCI
jgi:hypothetical protein